MNTVSNTNKELVLKSVAKIVTDKEAVRSYIKGKTTIQSLTNKGKLTTAIHKR